MPVGCCSFCVQPESLGCFVQVAANWAYSLFFIMGGRCLDLFSAVNNKEIKKYPAVRAWYLKLGFCFAASNMHGVQLGGNLQNTSPHVLLYQLASSHTAVCVYMLVLCTWLLPQSSGAQWQSAYCSGKWRRVQDTFAHLGLPCMCRTAAPASLLALR